MYNLPSTKNAVAAIRISSVKQGLQGDSPEDQKQQIERFAKAHNITIKKFFIFMESASKEEQPVQEAIDYCTSSKNNIQLFIIKSIDRFTRGGSYLYDHLKRQLDSNDVKLIDIYGVISNQEVNTLDHLGVEYDWSVYSPTKKSEILEAERAKDEMRDIMTRMIGAEIRYVRMGYRVRRAPFGYVNKKIDTPHGKRVILKPHPQESKWILKMYDLRLQGTLNDTEIVEELNQLGFKTRTFNKRDPNNKTKIIGEGGGKPLNLKQFWRYIRNPVYAGINIEKWTDGKPVKGQFEGLVSVKMFNKANRGKITIVQEDGQVRIYKKKPPAHLANKQVKNPNFPYKKHVHCPKCDKPLFGSASRGKLGKYYPAYHCHARGHYFRVPKKEFDQTIQDFIGDLNIKQEFVNKLKKRVLEEWNKRHESIKNDTDDLDNKIGALKTEAKTIAQKMRYVESAVAIKYLESDLIEVENSIKKLEHTKSSKENKENEVNMDVVMDTVGYYLEHLGELVLHQGKPLKQAEYFSLLFDKTPTYEDLSFGTPKLAPFIGTKVGGERVLFPNGDPAGNRTRITTLRG